MPKKVAKIKQFRAQKGPKNAKTPASRSSAGQSGYYAEKTVEN
jgi:hypothetical protein